MATYNLKKEECLAALRSYAPKVLALTRDVAELVSYASDNGFLSGQSNPISDADCLTVQDNAHLTAALFNSAMTAIATVNLNAGQKTTMRQVARQVIPPQS